MADETREEANPKESSRKARGYKPSITLAEALAKLPGPKGERFATVLEYGGLLVEIYAPRGHDPQTPHTRDEAYIVMQGSGEFLNGTERKPFATGDFLFVPAGVEHRFENFTDDLVLWVIFCGPEGGEALAEADEVDG